jgi:hypothetical protein
MLTYDSLSGHEYVTISLTHLCWAGFTLVFVSGMMNGTQLASETEGTWSSGFLRDQALA